MTGDVGVTDGTGTLNATVSKVATIEIFAGETRTAEQREEVELAGSITCPKGLTELNFSWEFGDGPVPAQGGLEAGITQAVAIHAHSDHRPVAYTATLTITAQSNASEVEASSSVRVLVTEASRWVISGWSPGDGGKGTVRALSGVGQGLETFFIRAAILSPVWIVGVGAALFVIRRRRCSSPSPDTAPDSQ